MSENSREINEIEARRKLKFWEEKLEGYCAYLLDSGYLGFTISEYTNNHGNKYYRAFQRFGDKVRTVHSVNLRDMKKKVDEYIIKHKIKDEVMRKNS